MLRIGTLLVSFMLSSDLHIWQRSRDPLGVRVHTALAAVFCLCIPGPLVAVEISALALVVCALIRIDKAWRLYGAAVADIRMLMAIIWAALTLLSISWSPNKTQGWDEALDLRFVLAPIALFPVLDRRRLLLTSLAIGFLLANMAQLVHWIGMEAHVPSLVFDRLPDRNSGWWRPVAGGSMLTGALGMHLALAVAAPPSAPALVMLTATMIGLLATGTRGAWIAASILVFIAIVFLIAKGVRSRRAIGLAIVLVAALAVSAVALRAPIMGRIDAAKHEITRALSNNDYASDTGARIAMAQWAWRAAAAHPVAGVGAGGYRSWCESRMRQEAEDPGMYRIHDHAHNTILHAAATTGFVTAGLLTLCWLGAIRSGMRTGPVPDAAAIAASGGLLGLLLVSPFDVIQLNTQTAALMWMLFSFCLTKRPALFVPLPPKAPREFPGIDRGTDQFVAPAADASSRPSTLSPS